MLLYCLSISIHLQSPKYVFVVGKKYCASLKPPAAVPCCYASVADLPTVILEPDVAGLSYEGEHTLLPVECKVGRDTCQHVSISSVATCCRVCAGDGLDAGVHGDLDQGGADLGVQHPARHHRGQ